MTMSYYPSLLFLILFGPFACSQDLGVPPTIDMSDDVAPDIDSPADMKQTKEPGESCFGPSECGAHLCIGAGAERFECMVKCETPYEICENGAVCLPLNGRPESICYTGGAVPKGSACQTNIDCVSGNLCIGAENTFYCVASCGEPEDCLAGSSCLELSTGASVCVRDLGKICDTGFECPPELICSSEHSAFVDAFFPGICTASECANCPADSACITLKDATKPVCLPGCVDDSDCRFIRGWRCRDREFCVGTPETPACEATVAQKSVCVPPEVP